MSALHCTRCGAWRWSHARRRPKRCARKGCGGGS